MATPMKAWQCIGCGRLEGQQPCIGICEDRPVDLVYAADHAPFEALVRRLASTTPLSGEWERTYRALQEEARALLGQPGRPSTRGLVRTGT